MDFICLYVINSITEGDNLNGDLVLDTSGAIYGTTLVNGGGYGTVYKLTNVGGSWSLYTLYRFKAGASDAGNPAGSFMARRLVEVLRTKVPLTG